MTTTNKQLLDELKQLNLSLDEYRRLQQLDITIDDIKRLHKTALWNAIQKKLRKKQQQSNVRYLLGVLDRLKNEKMRPSLNARVSNPLADYYNAKKTESENIAAKRVAYNRALDLGAVAMDEKFNKIPLGASGAEFNNVELVGGLWRIQNKFDKAIVNVRDRQFVLLDKLPHVERTLFEFYRASHIGMNCYGPFCSGIADYIVAKYDTDNGTYWSYGRSVEEARAFLGIKMYDEYMYLINSVARAGLLAHK